MPCALSRSLWARILYSGDLDYWKSEHTINPNVTDLYRGKTRQSVSDVAAHSLGQVEAYFTVRDVLAEASTVVPPKAGLWREHSAFGRWRFATLGLI